MWCRPGRLRAVRALPWCRGIIAFEGVSTRQKRRFAPEQHLRIALPGGVVEKLLSNQGLAHAAGSSSVSCVDVGAIFGPKRDEG